MDFVGEWRGDVAMTVNSALGNVTIAVPNDVGIRVESSKFLSSFEGNGLVNKNGAWETENFDTAKHKLRVRSTGVLGHFAVTRQPK
jgi:predicted membrane protein